MARLLLPLFLSFLLFSTTPGSCLRKALINFEPAVDTTITETKDYFKTLTNPTKLTHLHFYFHDTVSGNNITAVRVASGRGTNTSSTAFGLVFVVDDPLTEGTNISSKEVGKGQGIYASADQKNLGLLMEFNLVFTSGEFAGSSLVMFGRNRLMSKVREMAIVGGTGKFRFGRGYAKLKTFVFDLISKNAVVEYNVYVWHF